MKNLKADNYLKSMNEVIYCIFNPMGLGAIKIHLIPAKKTNMYEDCIVIFNGRYIITLNYIVAIAVTCFLKRINFFDGNEVSSSKIDAAILSSINESKEIFPFKSKSFFKEQLKDFINVVISFAKGKAVESNFSLSTNEYAIKMEIPMHLNLLVTSSKCHSCNQKCIYCFNHNQKQLTTNELPTDTWKKIIDKLWCEIYVPHITFTGIEPTLRSDIVELIDYSKNFLTSLHTNGILLENASICKELKKADLDSLQITLYSSNEFIHNKHVGTAAFKKTVKGIKNALEAGLNVTVKTPILLSNKDYMNTLQFLHNIGVKNVSLSGIIYTGNVVCDIAKETELTKKDFTSIIKNAHEFCVDTKMNLSFKSPGQVPEDFLDNLHMSIPVCGACLTDMAICPNGDVVPCQYWLGEESKLGNILNSSFDEIWNNRKSVQVRNYISHNMYSCPFRK